MMRKNNRNNKFFLTKNTIMIINKTFFFPESKYKKFDIKHNTRKVNKMQKIKKIIR